MSSNEPPRIAIVGGGISGLSAAWFLEQQAAMNQRPLQIDLYESGERLGGKIRTEQRAGLVLEAGAESFLSRKRAGVALCRALGIADQLRGTRPEHKKTFVWHEGELSRLPEGLTGFVPGNLGSLRSTSLLSVAGKLRVAADLVLPARRGADDESLASFISRRIGRQAYERLVQPLLCGIYCGDGNELSLLATYPELRELEKKHGSLIRGLRSRKNGEAPDSYPPFVTLPGGMSDLVRAISRQLSRTRIQLSHPISSLQRSSTGYEINEVCYHAVIFATPSFATAELVSDFVPELATQLYAIPHVSTAVVNLWFDSDAIEHELDGYGFVIPSSQQHGVTAVTWTSSKHFDRVDAGRKLIRVYLGRSGAEIDAQIPDNEILKVTRRELGRTMGVDIEADNYLIHRWIKGSPQYTLGHLERLASIEKSLQKLPGVYLCGASYRGVGIPDCIGEAEHAATAVLNYLKAEEK